MKEISSLNMTAGQVESERGAGWVYWWLFVSPLITVPWMAFNLASLRYSVPASDYVWAALWPALAHGVLLFGLRSRYLYARRHAQQALLLVVLRAGSTALFLGLSEGGEGGICLWVIVNGLLWLWGSRWGQGQVKRGECWLIHWRLDDAELLRSWAATGAHKAATRRRRFLEVEPPRPWAATGAVDARAAFSRAQGLAQSGRRVEAAADFLVAFRAGSPDLRRRAVEELEKLGEVETF